MANETVLFKRGDSATITSTPVTDGQILFDTSGNGKMYLDNGTDRLEMGGAITVDASLSKTSTNAIQNKAVTGNILNSLAEVSAATQQNTIAGALALKEVNASLAKFIYISEIQYTVDTVVPANSYNDENLHVITVPDGYKIISAEVIHTGSDKVLSFGVQIINNTNGTVGIKIYLKNISNYDITVKPKFRAVFCKIKL